ncbi:squalene synthase HpnC [Pararobbsia alpina]|uniref:Hydroxysqualene synthase n=1 Tax=Pararobbsia alpina TaxID=621374 RepID=A0A6S7C337_9BURK|nr:squalene synthase HpnC [Pararobbsia alpina]CAB3800304.1 Hydroxysqualene synthase [Pararobbsia alpina]
MTEAVKVEHYENFPVASVLLPKAMRAPVGVIYNFARGADDIADEGDAPADARHEGLAAYRRELDAIRAGRPTSPGAPMFTQLAQVVKTHRLDLQLFYDLLSAFDQDVDVKRYADYEALRDYCRRSADPVGRLMLGLFEFETPDNLACSDAICTSLQLINFWQDVEVDWRKERVYLPQADMARFGVSDADIAAQKVDERWRALMRHEVGFARELMLRGAPLATRIPGRFGLELCCVVHGGLRILDMIERVDYDVFRHRPKLGKLDAAIVFARGLGMWLTKRHRQPQAVSPRAS